MLEYLQKEELNVVICTIPMYTTYLQQRTPEILERRNSVLQMIQKKYPKVRILNKETDTLNYNVKDFTNPSHLNPDGAKKFSQMLSKELEALN